MVSVLSVRAFSANEMCYVQGSACCNRLPSPLDEVTQLGTCWWTGHLCVLCRLCTVGSSWSGWHWSCVWYHCKLEWGARYPTASAVSCLMCQSHTDDAADSDSWYVRCLQQLVWYEEKVILYRTKTKVISQTKTTYIQLYFWKWINTKTEISELCS